MSLLRCFTCIEVRQQATHESSIALLQRGNEDDKIRLRSLSWVKDKSYNGEETTPLAHGPEILDSRRDNIDVECDTSNVGVTTRFTRAEIDNFKKFSSLPWFGYGENSIVYLDRLPDSTGVALKFCNGGGISIFKHELKILRLLHHDNIVKLRGYCDDQGEHVLVLENTGNQTLRDRLSTEAKSGDLSWKNRMKIAYQLSQAIEYLHKKCPQQIIHGDIKPCNITLDEQLNCKLCNFKTARIGRQDGSTPPSQGQFVLDYPGYTDFHYLSTGIALKEHDIYSFGIIVLELITGVEAIWLHSRGRVESLAYSMMNDDVELVKFLDPSLEGEFELKEAKTMVSISAICLHRSISRRPSSSNIVRKMRKNIHSIKPNQQKEFAK